MSRSNQKRQMMMQVLQYSSRKNFANINLEELESRLANTTADSERISLLDSILKGVNWSIIRGTLAKPMYRVTRWDTPPKTVRNLSYPPPEFVKEYGRANHPNKSMLYLAAHPYSPIQEVGLELNEPFVLSTWKAVDKLRIIDLGGNRKGYKNSGTQAQDISTRRILEYFSQAFCNNDSDHSYYMLTSTISHLLLDGDKNSGSPYDAILYPSAQSNVLRENMVVKPIAADRVFKLDKAVFGSMTDFSSDKRYGTFESQQRTVNISHSGDITWEKTSGRPEHIHIEPANS